MDSMGIPTTKRPPLTVAGMGLSVPPLQLQSDTLNPVASAVLSMIESDVEQVRTTGVRLTFTIVLISSTPINAALIG
jgi:hypothetical protein